ncbi:MAG TPA: hypothetical protein VM915_14040, partial [Verrucomicrobiae bacterium]|nr:hypothetical protein [Verrucomicrobiae bacterium]
MHLDAGGDRLALTTDLEFGPFVEFEQQLSSPAKDSRDIAHFARNLAMPAPGNQELMGGAMFKRACRQVAARKAGCCAVVWGELTMPEPAVDHARRIELRG